MNISAVNNSNMHIYLNLAQSYEGEFSRLTQKRPDKNGVFPLDTHIGDNTSGYLLFVNKTPAGLAAILSHDATSHEVCEFYIVPCFRHKRLGMNFACLLFDISRGNWQVKQLQGADDAVTFWRKVIAGYTSRQYVEDVYSDEYWGTVTRQQFSNGASPLSIRK